MTREVTMTITMPLWFFILAGFGLVTCVLYTLAAGFGLT